MGELVRSLCMDPYNYRSLAGQTNAQAENHASAQDVAGDSSNSSSTLIQIFSRTAAHGTGHSCLHTIALLGFGVAAHGHLPLRHGIAAGDVLLPQVGSPRPQ